MMKMMRTTKMTDEKLEIKIDEGAIKDLVSKAIMDQIGPEGRERLVAAALEHLLRFPEKDEAVDGD
jgi:hypothetical protein